MCAPASSCHRSSRPWRSPFSTTQKVLLASAISPWSINGHARVRLGFLASRRLALLSARRGGIRPVARLLVAPCSHHGLFAILVRAFGVALAVAWALDRRTGGAVSRDGDGPVLLVGASPPPPRLVPATGAPTRGVADGARWPDVERALAPSWRGLAPRGPDRFLEQRSPLSGADGRAASERSLGWCLARARAGRGLVLWSSSGRAPGLLVRSTSPHHLALPRHFFGPDSSRGGAGRARSRVLTALLALQALAGVYAAVMEVALRSPGRRRPG